MKRTLYQVLGVERDASVEAIAAAYEARVAELKAAPSLDQSAAALLGVELVLSGLGKKILSRKVDGE